MAVGGEEAAGETSKCLAGAVRTARRYREGQQAYLDFMRAEERPWESSWRWVWRLEREKVVGTLMDD